ncbi:hypothetical protein D9M71_723240 [compost metagenome]
MPLGVVAHPGENLPCDRRTLNLAGKCLEATLRPTVELIALPLLRITGEMHQQLFAAGRRLQPAEQPPGHLLLAAEPLKGRRRTGQIEHMLTARPLQPDHIS